MRVPPAAPVLLGYQLSEARKQQLRWLLDLPDWNICLGDVDLPFEEFAQRSRRNAAARGFTTEGESAITAGTAPPAGQ